VKSALIGWLVVFFVICSPWLITRKVREKAEVSFDDLKFSVKPATNGTVTVQLGRKKETVPAAQLRQSELFQEAMSKLNSHLAVGQKYWAVEWKRLLLYWLPGALISAGIMAWSMKRNSSNPPGDRQSRAKP
jgi:hypothetical protein